MKKILYLPECVLFLYFYLYLLYRNAKRSSGNLFIFSGIFASRSVYFIFILLNGISLLSATFAIFSFDRSKLHEDLIDELFLFR